MITITGAHVKKELNELEKFLTRLKIWKKRILIKNFLILQYH